MSQRTKANWYSGRTSQTLPAEIEIIPGGLNVYYEGHKREYRDSYIEVYQGTLLRIVEFREEAEENYGWEGREYKLEDMIDLLEDYDAESELDEVE